LLGWLSLDEREKKIPAMWWWRPSVYLAPREEEIWFFCVCVSCVSADFTLDIVFPSSPLLLGGQNVSNGSPYPSHPEFLEVTQIQTNQIFIENIRKNAGQPGRIRTGRGYIRVNKKMCVRVSCVHNFRLSFVTFSYDVYQRNDMPRELDTAGEFYISPAHLY
jgi:hypothetical protein